MHSFYKEFSFPLTAQPFLQSAQFHARAVGGKFHVVESTQRVHDIRHFRVIPVRLRRIVTINSETGIIIDFLLQNSLNKIRNSIGGDRSLPRRSNRTNEEMLTWWSKISECIFESDETLLNGRLQLFVSIVQCFEIGDGFVGQLDVVGKETTRVIIHVIHRLSATVQLMSECLKKVEIIFVRYTVFSLIVAHVRLGFREAFLVCD